MSINKFGIQLAKGDTRRGEARWSGDFRNYVRDNSICVVGEIFDAKSRKIRRLADPETDSDAVNKRYLDRHLRENRARHEYAVELVHSTIQNFEKWKEDNKRFHQAQFKLLEDQIIDLRKILKNKIVELEEKIKKIQNS